MARKTRDPILARPLGHNRFWSRYEDVLAGYDEQSLANEPAPVVQLRLTRDGLRAKGFMIRMRWDGTALTGTYKVHDQAAEAGFHGRALRLTPADWAALAPVVALLAQGNVLPVRDGFDGYHDVFEYRCGSEWFATGQWMPVDAYHEAAEALLGLAVRDA